MSCEKSGKILFLSVLLILFFIRANNVDGVVSNSPHDIISWSGNQTTIVLFEKAGICSFCHAPHSAKGERLFPQTIDSADAYGKIAAICWKCHGSNVYLGRNEPKLLNEIYVTLDTNHTAQFGEQDSHPVIKTNQVSQSQTLQNTEISDTLGWPWTSGWSGWKNTAKPVGTKDIECTTCHNPHDWNSDAWGVTGKRKFLRKPLYETAGNGGRGKSFCEYCHTDRDSDTTSNALGTHPVGRQARYSDCTTSTGGGVGTTVVISWRMIKSLADSTVLDASGERWGKACWDTATTNEWIGARLGPNHETGAPDVIICQSCHMPHGVSHSQDDVYYDTGTAPLRVGPLLAVNNAYNFADTFNAYTPEYSKSNYPFPAETPYVLNSGEGEENLLCEWCHGMTPDLNNTANALGVFAHPLNNYPTPTNDNLSSDTSFGTMLIKYPPAAWLKYRESGGIRGVGGVRMDGGVNRIVSGGNNTGPYFLVCLSCHEAHQAQPGTAILKKGFDTVRFTFCDECHDNAAMGNGPVSDIYFTTWTTHPSGPAAKLWTSDARYDGKNIKLPNRAGLRTFGSGDSTYVSCATCHNVHGGVERPMLADYQSYSQICVNCHAPGIPVTLESSKVADWKYGTTEGTDPNPSLYYLEGSWPSWWEDVFAGNPNIRTRHTVDDPMRLGSHYIGQFTRKSADRPDTSAAKGWLGERNVYRRGSAGLMLTQFDHRRGDSGNGDSTTDRWLDTGWMDTSYLWEGSGQASHLGKIGYESVIICQTCHTPHNSATGVADDSATSRLLLGSNFQSLMCKKCHLPDSHVMDPDGEYTYETMVGITGNKNLITHETSEIAYNNNTTYSPANYPKGIRNTTNPNDYKLNCDGCHTAHNADTKMGAMILEGDSLDVAGNENSNFPSKNRTVKERNDKRTCDLCHRHGTR